MASFMFEQQVAAPAETVFEVLTDHGRYAEITPLRKSVLERQGEPGPNGVGAIRVLSVAGPPLREEVIAYEPSTRFSYKLLSGLQVVYAVRTTPTVPLAGAAVVAVVKVGVKQLLSGIASESERRTANG